jgi:hypothetical protein
MQMCDECIRRLLPKTADWMAWLLVADRVKLQGVTARAVPKMVRNLVCETTWTRQASCC